MDAHTDQVVVQVKFKVKDVLRYNMWVALKNNINKGMLVLGLILLGTYFYKMFYRTVSLDIFIATHVLLLIVPIMIFILIPWRVWKITLTQMQMEAFALGVEYTFSTQKIILDLGNKKDEISWDIFIKIVETPKDFRLFVDNIRAQILPKHNFTTEQLAIFKEVAIQATKEDICTFLN